MIDLDERYDIRLDAISWHENDGGHSSGYYPEDIPGYAYYIRSRLAYHLPGYEPDLHINWFAGGRIHLSPGYNVGFWSYLADSPIAAAMRACWWIMRGVPPYDVWCNCWAGLDGLLMRDGETAAPVGFELSFEGFSDNEAYLITITEDPALAAVAGSARQLAEFLFEAIQSTPTGCVIALWSSQAGPVRLSIHDLNGREIVRLIDRHLTPGSHEVHWDGRDSAGRLSPGGCYYLRLGSAAARITASILLTR